MQRLLDKLVIPEEIQIAMDSGATLIIAYSGGKDSDTMLVLLPLLCEQRGWKKPIIIHCDLGRAEWYYTPGYVERRAKESGLELRIVKRPQGDLLQRFQQNVERRPGIVPFSDAKNRFCTSELKTGPTDSEIAKMFPARRASKKNPITHIDTVIVAQGIRSQESPARAKKPIFSIRRETQSRLVLDWNPIKHFSLDDVWATLGETLDSLKELQIAATSMVKAGADPDKIASRFGFNWHIAYLLGNVRLSCSICILAGKDDILRGIEHNPQYYVELVKIEIDSGFSFRQDMWLGDLRQDLLPADVLDAYTTMRRNK